MSYFQINKIDAIDSTNEEVKRLFHQGAMELNSVLLALHQTHGKGQRDAQWLAAPYQNLTFSVLIPALPSTLIHPFELNTCVSLALKEGLSKFKIPNLSIKWPNDILSGNDKICGILIETIFRGVRPIASVIGIGLNVNQVTFDHLPHASSMRLCAGQMFDLDEVFIGLLVALEKHLESGQSYSSRIKAYQDQMYGVGKWHRFRKNDEVFEAKIKGITEEGLLLLASSQGKESFAIKTIQMLR